MGSFADSWSVSSHGACSVNALDSVQIEKSKIDAVTESLENSPVPFSQFPDVMEAVGSVFYATSAAVDLEQAKGNTDPSSNYLYCSCLRALVYSLGDAGIVVDRWDTDLSCPSPQQMRVEAVRLGCPWTQNNAPF